MGFGSIADGIGSATAAINDFTDLLSGTTRFKLYDFIGQGGINKIKNQNPKQLPYWLEIVDGSVISSYTFPRSVEGWQASHKPRQAVTFTQGGLFQDVIGIAPPQIRINGTFGYEANANNSRPGEAGDGYEKYVSLEGMIQTFYLQFGKYSSSGRPIDQGGTYFNGKNHALRAVDPTKLPSIRFYDFVMGEFWEVAVDAFTFSRSTQRRMLYMYDIQMTALKRVAPSPLPQPFKLERTGSIGKFLDALDAAQTLYTNVKNFLNAVNRLTTTVKGIIARCINFVTQLASLIRSADSTITAITDIPSETAQAWNIATKQLEAALAGDDSVPADFVVEARAIVRVSNALLGKIQNTIAVPPIIVAKSDTTPVGVEVIDSDVSAQAQQAGFVSLATPPEAATPSYGLQSTSIGSITVTDSDTILSLAQKAGIDWQQLVTLNNLDYPYITTAEESSTAGLNVLRPGGTVLIPGASTVSTDIDMLGTHEEALYGIDIYLDNDGNKELPAGDVTVISGINNLVMQLEHRLKTTRGELAELGHPEYGSLVPTFIGNISTPAVIERIRLECELTLLQDPRVASVTGSSVSQNGTALYFSGQVYPVEHTSPVAVNINLS